MQIINIVFLFVFMSAGKGPFAFCPKGCYNRETYKEDLFMEIRLPFDRFHPEALENWLNTQAKEGRVLVQLGRFSAEFEEAEQRIQYHIDAADEAMREKLEAAGWQKVCVYRKPRKARGERRQHPGLLVYASTSKTPKVPDLEEPEREAFLKAHAREVRRNLVGSLWIPFLSLMFMSMMEAFYGNQVGTLYLDDRILWLFAVFTGISVLVILRAVRRQKALSMWKKHRTEKTPTDFYAKIQLREEKALPLRDGFRKAALITMAVLVGIELILVGVRLVSHRSEAVSEATPEYRTLCEIEGTGVTQTLIDGFPNDVKVDRSLLVPSQRVVRFGGETEETQIAIRVCEYEALNEGFAQELMIARMEAQLNWNIFISASEISVAGADLAYYAGYQGFQYLFMRTGSRVVTVFYHGDLKLSDHAGAFASYLQ